MTIINKAQILASDPSISAWVSASAGTGKTRILTNRVLRLMLDGASPDKILCLTFTKAAAKEMENRINENLLLWQKLDSANLYSSLEKVLGRIPTKDEIKVAPNLFKSQINAIAPIKIQTIHSFCQYILDKFPLEARVAPGFKVIDEFKSAEIINKVRIDIISNSGTFHDAKLKEAIEFIAGNLHDLKISALVEKIVQDKVKFRELSQKYSSFQNYKQTLENDFLGEEINISNLELFKIPSFGAEEGDLAKIEQYNHLIRSSSKEELICFFLTQEYEPRKTLLTKKWSQKYPAEYEHLLSMQKIFVKYVEYKKAESLIKYSSYLFLIAKYILADYEYYKRIFGYLDYDDLIIKTRDLLINSDTKAWVLYKLDGGLEHILVDEAQDTSKEQWQIIEAIASEFYSGFTRSDKNRTIFVVGDEKQSIYSFQGADPACYRSMNEYFSKQMLEAQKKYENINLEISYRSTKEINEFVAKVFCVIPDFPTTSIITNRSEECGSVEIWPTIFGESSEIEAWPLPIEQENIQAYEKLSSKIAEYIASECHVSKEYSPFDFLILVRKRTDLINAIIRHLEARNIKVAGIDRMKIIENIVTLDILALAKFILLPEDELNLAELLKSPFIKIQEDQLAELCINRGGVSLYQFILQNHYDIGEKLEFFQQKYMNSNLFQFFFEIFEIDGFRKDFIEDQGALANDVINEFLDLAYFFEHNEQNSMQNFIFWLENANIELKRDLESGEAVRIMTIHGSKGLQAKNVIIIDNMSARFPYSLFLWHEKGYCLFPGNISNYIPDYHRLLEEKKQKDYEEYLRLLYVGLTRAEDNLIIASYAEGTKIDEKSWYSLLGIKNN